MNPTKEELSIMKENKKEILEILKKQSKKPRKYENLVVNLALQKLNTDKFEFDGKMVFNADKTILIYVVANDEAITVPDTVKVIGQMAFMQHQKLKEITIPTSVEKIEKEAFAECDNLAKVVIPASVKGVYGFAFSECDRLKEVVFEGVPEHLGKNSFIGCEQLHTFRVPNGSAQVFRKALHIIDDPDILVIEKDDPIEKKHQQEKGEEEKSKKH